MKYRIVHTLVVFSLLYAIGCLITVIVLINNDKENALLAIILGITAIAIASGIQYIVIGKWSPFNFLSKNND